MYTQLPLLSDWLIHVVLSQGMAQYMERAKSSFQWYWLLDEDAHLPLMLAVIISLILLFPHRPYLWLAAAVLLALATRVATWHQKRVYERLGPDRVRPPKALTAFWRILLAADVLAFALWFAMNLRETIG